MLLHAGLVVEQVTPGSIAERAGLRPGCKLLTCQKQTLLSPAMLMAWEQNAPCPGQSLALLVKVEGEQRTVELEWGETGLITRPNLSGPELTLYLQGKAGFEAQDYALAADCWNEAAERAQTRLSIAWLRVRAAEAWELVPDWQEAHDSYAKASALWEDGDADARRSGSGETIGTEGDERDTATLSLAWMAQGKCCHYLGKSEEATAWLARAEQIEKQAGRLGWLAHTLHDRGTIAFYRGDLLTADSLFRRALALREQLNPASMDTASSLNNLGLNAWKQGQFSQARSCLTRALRIIENFVPDSLTVAILLNNLGLLAWQQGDLQHAQECHVRALALRERHDSASRETAMSLLNLGAVFEDGDPLEEDHDQLEKAQDCYTRALAIAEGQPAGTPGVLSLLAECRINMGSVARRQDNLTDAQDHYEVSLAILERLAPNGTETASCLSNMGSLAAERAQFARSEKRPADERAEWKRADQYYARALNCCEHAAPSSPTHADVLWEMGKAALKGGRPEEAVMRCLQSVETVERLRTDLDASDARALLVARHAPKYATLLQAYLALGDVAGAFYTLERARARSLVELLSERALDFAAAAPTALLERQQALDQERRVAYERLQALASTSDEAEPLEPLRRDLRRLEREQQDLITQMRASCPQYASVQYPQPVSLSTAQTLLEPGTLLLSYLVDDERTYLFAVTNTNARLVTLPIGRAELAKQSQALREVMKAPTLREPGAERATEAGRNLYASLLRPLEEWLANAERILICPDGTLHTLPFGALVTNRRGRPCYLGTEKPLRHVLSMTTYAQMREALSTEENDNPLSDNARQGKARPTSGSHPSDPDIRYCRVFALGDPLYADESNLPGSETRGMPPLPHTRQEVAHLADLFPDTHVCLGAEATKAAILRSGPDADILHLACHGWFDPKTPLSSALLLAQPAALDNPSQRGENGLLQAWEILQSLKLRAKLVVLSACRSGLGAEVRGEGLIGLTRAFQYAGARSLVVSLWEINDTSTSLFMQAFYTSLRAGESKDQSLRQAMRTLQQSPRWNHPYYWSAFVLIGDRSGL